MSKQKVMTRDLVRLLSGFGPHYQDLMECPDVYRGVYGSYVYVETCFRRVKYVLKFQADYDVPGAVYLSDIIKGSTGEHWFASSVSRDAYMDTYPIDWAWV